MKKTLTVIGRIFTVLSTILIMPFVISGFLFAIPAIAFYKGFELAKSMIDSGKL